MTNHFNELFQADDNIIVVGDALSTLRQLKDKSVQCAVTSPPYWSVRDYGHPRQIGLEATLPEYLNRLMAVFSEVRRVLRDDGLLWLNLGDGYTSGNRNRRAPDHLNRAREMSARPRTPEGLKAKDLLGVPWRLAIALQSQGWHLRSDTIWHKPNAMPESVKDRPTRCHEYLFMLSKSERYFYDREAVLENNGRNPRSVWSINTKPYKGAHFATYPEDLVRPCILSSTKPGDIVLDPFFGSGTTGVVAADLRRRYVGIDLNTDYVELARDRLQDRPPTVFRAFDCDPKTWL
ncbi:DNA-methyltransferase [Aliiruegeria sabulilitoris]|uniref:DNA-methyltransferase n=1 Tax=Aliiruegeria sabulilitoris TaxID=1510458 RepID=UPI000829789F|nr:site-specific DNA-methyltransferase [Aliiruegeria sabulilitoris]NDR56319.1 site-specific DNA-methyltransferase [Pseudoruegeria sp. M32A2M]